MKVDSSGYKDGAHRVSLESALKDACEGPSAEARERIRGRVLSDVRARAVPSVARGAFMRSVAIFAALAIGIGATSMAAADALPGSPLYPFKRAMEEIRVQLTPPGARSEALVDVARERVREVRRLMDAEASDSSVDVAVEGFDDAAKRALEHESDPDMVRERVRELEDAVSGETEPVRERVEEGTESPGGRADDAPAGPDGDSGDSPGKPDAPGPGPGPGDGDGPGGDSQSDAPGSKSP